MEAIGYQPSVGLKVGSTPAVRSAGPAIAYGDGSGYDAMARGFGAVLSLVEKEREEDMVADVTAAKNEYDRRISDLLYNEENGLMHKKLANARGIGKTFEEEEKKIRADILPMLPKYEKAHIAFANLADKDSQRNFNTVRNYSLEQKKAYRDVNLTNSINFKMENAQHYYKDPSAVKEQLDAIYTDIRANCENEYGAEWCRAKYEEYEAKTVSSAVETAIASDDRDAARELISVFGDRVPPNVLNRYRKGIMDADKDDEMLTTAEQIYKNIGGDMTKLDAELAKYDTAEIATGGTYYKMKETYEEYKGTPYDWGGTTKNGIDCSSFTQKAYANAGEQIPRTSETQLHYMEQKGRFVPNDGKYTPQAGDIVFITNTNAKFKPTDDWAASQDPDKNLAYKGVTHVGIVSENGTILQAGSSKGVSEVPMSAFAGKIMGYGKAAGVQRVPRSAREKQELRNKVFALDAQNKRIENERIQNRVNSAEDAMWELYQAGVTDPRQFEAIAKRYADDPETYRKVKRIAANYIGRVSGGGKMSRDDEAIIKDNIDTGRYIDEGSLRDALNKLDLSPAEIRDLVSYYRKSRDNNVGWDSMKKEFQRDISKNEGLWRGAKAAAEDFIQDYIEKNNRQPSYAQIKDALYKATVKPENSMFANNSDYADFEKMGISPATMRAMSISNARPNRDGTVTVTYPDGSVAKMNKDEFNARVSRNS